MQRKVRYAVVGLGHIAQNAVLPAFAGNIDNSQVTALITDDKTQADEIASKFGIEKVWMYEDLDQAFASGVFDAIYIAVPNDLHMDIAVSAANAGIHVLSEKPMALNSSQCEQMIAAAKSKAVKLMIAYRLRFEPTNLAAISAIEEGKIGEPRVFTSTFCLQVQARNYRTRKVQGGGPLMDIGLYCINAARNLFKEEPIEVFATAVSNDDPRFAETEEAISVVMKFPGEKLAAFTCSFGAFDTLHFEVIGTKGAIKLDPAYEYRFDINYTLRTAAGVEQFTTPAHDQFAREIHHFSDCVINDKQPIPDGAEGLADMKIVDAIFQSATTRKPVTLS